MMKTKTEIALLCMASWALGACEKELISDDPVVTESSVSVLTRSLNAEETISFPMNVYVFGSENKEFVRHEKLVNDENPLAFTLPLGSYSIYAIGGADDDHYVFPADNEVTEESEILLKEGKEHADLMTAHSTILLEEKEDYRLTLHMERQVIELTSALIKNVPEEVTSVCISLSTSYKGIKVNGELGTEWSRIYTLIDNGEGEWSLPVPVMILLKPESVSIHITMTYEDGTTRNYTLTCPEDLAKNYQISITATYQENDSVNIIGSITGSTWAGNKEIIFDFDESNANNGYPDNHQDEDDNNSGNSYINEPTPSTGTIYKDCYVLHINDEDNDYNEVVLLYQHDFEIDATDKTEEQVIQEIGNQLSPITINGISGWRLPNETEAEYIVKQRGRIIQSITMTNNGFYYYMADNRLKIFGNNSLLHQLTYTQGNHYIPVTILKFKK